MEALREIAAIDRGGGEAEVREKVVSHAEGQLVVALFQIDDLVAQDRLALVGEQGEAIFHARVEADFRILADFQRRVVREDAELVRVLVIRDLDAGFRNDGLAEAIRSGDPQPVGRRPFRA